MANYIAGIDEAGRGPLIGPLVICVAAVDESQEHILKEWGVKDSKLLSEAQRESILARFKDIVKFKLVMIEPAEIDDAVLGKRINLNWLEAEHGAKLLNALDEELRHSITKTIIDCPSTNIKAYTEYFAKNVDNKDIELVVEHKADFNHLIVGAASIIAKVTREKELERIKREYNIDFGSGYPSDPKTKEFVAKHHDSKPYEKLFRKSWATFVAASKKNAQSSLDKF